MTTRRSNFLAAALFILAAGGFAGVAMVKLETSREPAPANLKADSDQPRNNAEESSFPVINSAPSPVREAEVVPFDPSLTSVQDKPSPKPAEAAKSARLQTPPAKPQFNPAAPAETQAYYQVAREALSRVGADADAEDEWIDAINDPAFSAKQRQDLIEDLNEEGFTNPKVPAWEELPLIVNRIQLIEEIAAEAMDETNAAAFEEARKDLVNMYLRLVR